MGFPGPTGWSGYQRPKMETPERLGVDCQRTQSVRLRTICPLDITKPPTNTRRIHVSNRLTTIWKRVSIQTVSPWLRHEYETRGVVTVPQGPESKKPDPSYRDPSVSLVTPLCPVCRPTSWPYIEIHIGRLGTERRTTVGTIGVEGLRISANLNCLWVLQTKDTETWKRPFSCHEVSTIPSLDLNLGRLSMNPSPRRSGHPVFI